MVRFTHTSLVQTLGLLAASVASVSLMAAELPEGGTGIAARYPGDQRIDRDPAVVFFESFADGKVEDLSQRWDTVVDPQTMTFTPDGAPGSQDGQALLITHTGGEGEGGQLYRRLLPGYDQLFARFYVKFAADCAPIHHFGTHLGGFNPPTPWPQGGAGERPDGAKRFTTGVEPYGKDWQWDFYSYWQNMRVHGDGNFWGTPFHAYAARPQVAKDRWICVEMMVKMNSADGSVPGEQAFWIDGKLWRVDDQITSHVGPGFPRGRWTGGWWQPDVKADTAFEGFQWRSTDKLSVNYVWAYLYITKARAGQVSKVWFDNIVVAKNYIGPIAPADAATQ